MGANDRQIGGNHYKTEIEHWDYVLANEIPYLEAMIIKYLTRWRKKDGHEDLRKAQHFPQKLFEVEDVEWDREELHEPSARENQVARPDVPARRSHKR